MKRIISILLITIVLLFSFTINASAADNNAKQYEKAMNLLAENNYSEAGKIFYFNIVAQTSENTVVTEYEPEASR